MAATVPRLTIKTRPPGLNEFPAGYHGYRTFHDYTLWAVESGSVRVRCNSQRMSLDPGDSIVFLPGEHCQFEVRSGVSFYSVHVTILNGWTESALDMGGRPVSPARRISRSCRFTGTVRRYREGCPFARIECGTLFLGMLRRVAGVADLRTLPLVPLSLDGFKEKVRHYVISHVSEPASIADFAEHMGYHRKYFPVVFRKHYGLTPLRYINERKMEVAVERILEGDTVKEVAFGLGFSDSYVLSKRFKSVCGVSPRSYLQRRRSEHRHRLRKRTIARVRGKVPTEVSRSPERGPRSSRSVAAGSRS